MLRSPGVRALAIPVLLALPLLLGQEKPSAAGHWEGAIDIPGTGPLSITVDLARQEKGNWIGDIDVPAQGLRDWPLSGITVKGSEVVFAMQGVPGDPSFQAALAEDGKTMSGTLTQGGGAVPFELTRTGEANVSVSKNTPLSKELEGVWEGTLEAAGQSLRLVLKLSRAADGTAAGVIDSPDQGATGIPITSIRQEGSSLRLELKQIGATYDAKLSEDRAELAGEWSQGGGTFPVRLRRATEKKG